MRHGLLRIVMLEAVPFSDVVVNDQFWSKRQHINRIATIPHCLEMLEIAGNFENFRLAAEGKTDGYKGPRYMDSDTYKVLEGICYSLTTHPDPELAARVDEIIDLIAAAQMPDGYLNTWHQVTRPDKRWTNLRDDHELYCAGHLIEAAVAHQQMQGSGNRSRLMHVALKFCEHIWLEFGPDGRPGYPGHPEIELALVKLWKLTGDQRWFDLAKLFIDRRGSGYFRKEHNGEMNSPFDERYFVDDLLVVQQRHGVGHAVRFCYLMCAASDIVAQTRDSELRRMLRITWKNVTERQTYITGGVGSNPETEGFAEDFALPNKDGYQETCASIAMAMWGHRLGPLGFIFDRVETVLYNTLLSGVAFDGCSFFYENPLESDGSHRREEWFTCACCPPNVLRTISKIAEFAYSRDDGCLYVNMFIGGHLRTSIGGQEFEMCVESDLLKSGTVTITIHSNRKLAIMLRSPTWGHITKCKAEGATFGGMIEPAGYRMLTKAWQAGDRIELEFDTAPHAVFGNPNVSECKGKVALRSGPLIYCVEQIDNSQPIGELAIDVNTKVERSSLDIEGTKIPTLLTANGMRFVPYAVWANREPGPMKVWIPSQ